MRSVSSAQVAASLTVFTARLHVTSSDAYFSPGAIPGTTPAVPATWRGPR